MTHHGKEQKDRRKAARDRRAARRFKLAKRWGFRAPGKA